MGQYRIEIAKTGRAGCQDGQCKKNNDKILKGQLRLGVWVEVGDHASWKWRHWGCTSGFIVGNMQASVSQDDTEKSVDDWDWDMLDGYDELEDHSDIQEKIRRVIEQGHIDPEDFNGDPEFNVPGQKAIRARATAKKKKDDEDDEDDAPATKKKPAAKRGRKDDEEEAQPAKKKAKGGRKSAVADEEEEEEVKPVKKGRGRKSAAADEEPAEKPKPAPKGKGATGRKAKKVVEDDDETQSEAEVKPAKKTQRRVSKKAPSLSPEVDEEPEPEPEPAPKSKAKRGRPSKAAAQDDEVEAPAPTKAKRGRSRK